MAQTDRDWEAKYHEGNTPWDSNLPSKELKRVLSEYDVEVGSAVEPGCGTGTNAVSLATLGWQVTAIDCSSLALEQAGKKALAARVEVEWIEADVQNLSLDGRTFALVFDRGCYHCCRRVDLDGYLATLRNLTHPGSDVLCLCGNPNDGTEGGPPRVEEADVRTEFDELCEIRHLRAFHFEDAGGVQGPYGWSVWMKRT